jgi:hypothetical protein
MKQISELRDCAAPVAKIFKIAQRKTARRRKPKKADTQRPCFNESRGN